jgi:spoIIIJ-associated protein
LDNNFFFKEKSKKRLPKEEQMGLFTKIFGGKNSTGEGQGLINDLLNGTIERAGLDISFDIKFDKSGDKEVIRVEFFGEDENLFVEKDGALLDAFQLFLKRALQHSDATNNSQLYCDCNGFRDKANQSLVELAEKLKNRALDQGKSVYLRALPPKDRKVIHQFLANDERVKSRSIGDGLYKKIKIYPNNKKESDQSTAR